MQDFPGLGGQDPCTARQLRHVRHEWTVTDDLDGDYGMTDGIG